MNDPDRFALLFASQVQHLETLVSAKEETVAQLQAELENEVSLLVLTLLLCSRKRWEGGGNFANETALTISFVKKKLCVSYLNLLVAYT